MSSGPALVRFPDGRIRFAIYHGTSDVLCEALHDTADEAWSAYQAGRAWLDDEPSSVVFVVDIWAYWGGGFGWRGAATWDRVTEGNMPHGAEDQMGHELEPVCELTRTPPDWVPEQWRL